MEFDQPVNYVLGHGISTVNVVNSFPSNNTGFSLSANHRNMLNHFGNMPEHTLKESQTKRVKIENVNEFNDAVDTNKDDDYDSSDEGGLVIDEDYVYMLENDKDNQEENKVTVDERLAISDKENNNEVKPADAVLDSSTDLIKSEVHDDIRYKNCLDEMDVDNNGVNDMYGVSVKDVKVSGARKRKSTNVERALLNLSQCQNGSPVPRDTVEINVTETHVVTDPVNLVKDNVCGDNTNVETREDSETVVNNQIKSRIPSHFASTPPVIEASQNPVKPSRRKKTIPSKYSTTERPSISPSFPTNVLVHSPNSQQDSKQGLIDLSANFRPVISVSTKSEDGPVDLSAPKSRGSTPTNQLTIDTPSEDEPLDLSMKTMKAKLQVKTESQEMLSQNESEFFEWLSNNRNRQLMQANVLQYHMWMQNASMRKQTNGWPNQNTSPLGNQMSPTMTSVSPMSPMHRFGSDIMAQMSPLQNGSPGGAFSMNSLQMPPFNVTRKFEGKPRRRKRKSISDGSPDSGNSRDSGDLSMNDQDSVMSAPELVKDGDSVKYYITDAKQVQAVVGDLIDASTIEVPEATEDDGTDLKVMYACQMCQCQFYHVEHLTKHIKAEHILKKYKCDQCQKSFSDAGNYRQHMRVHDETDIPYECPECHRRFRHKCTLKVHMRIHTGERPFQCKICSAAFKISSGLQSHMRKHTGETPYACEFCDMRFKCQSNLKQHMFQHTQARPFSCDVCGKSYSRKSIRDAHVATHRGTPLTLPGNTLPNVSVNC